MFDILSRLRLSPGDPGIAFVGALEDFRSLPRNSRAILCGQLVFASLTSSHPGRDYIRQFGRSSARRSLFPGKKTVELSVWGDKAAMTAAESNRIKVGFSVDHYLSWGVSRKAAAVLIGGYPDKASTTIQVMVFAGAQLKQIFEKNLPAYDHPRFPSELSYLLDEIRSNFPGYRLHWAAPLEPLPDDYLQSDIINIGMEPFRHLQFRPVIASEGNAPFLRRFGPGLGLLGTVALVSGSMLYAPWHSYRVTWQKYQFETDPQLMPDGRPRNFPAMLYRQANNKLEVLQMQKDFLQHPPQQIQLANDMRQLLNQIASTPKVTILAFWIGGQSDEPSGGGRPAPHIAMRISVPADIRHSALDQGNALLKELSERTGLTLHLAANGVEEKLSESGGRPQARIYKVEG